MVQLGNGVFKRSPDDLLWGQIHSLNGDLSLDVFSCQLRRSDLKALTEKCFTPTGWPGGLLLPGNLTDLRWLPGVYLRGN